MSQCTIRPLRVSDALAMASFRKRGGENHALSAFAATAPEIGAVNLLIHSLLPERGRMSWLSCEDGQMTGLVSARGRLAADIWDIDRLCFLAEWENPRLGADLLGQVIQCAYSHGVQRMFLRTRSGGSAEEAARECGFVRYANEFVYLLGIGAEVALAPSEFRPRTRVDHQPLFQLYTATVPARVRQVEGLTLQEWRATDGWKLYRQGLTIPSWRRDFVLELNSSLIAWLQTDSQRNGMRLLHRAGQTPGAEGVFQQALSHMDHARPTLVSAREYQSDLRLLLDRMRLAYQQHALLSRSLGVRVQEPVLVPASARAR